MLLAYFPWIARRYLHRRVLVNQPVCGHASLLHEYARLNPRHTIPATLNGFTPDKLGVYVASSPTRAWPTHKRHSPARPRRRRHVRRRGFLHGRRRPPAARPPIVGLTMQLWNQRRLPELQGDGPPSIAASSLDDVYDARRCRAASQLSALRREFRATVRRARRPSLCAGLSQRPYSHRLHQLQH
jgi:hypothetical protein